MVYLLASLTTAGLGVTFPILGSYHHVRNWHFGFERGRGNMDNSQSYEDI